MKVSVCVFALISSVLSRNLRKYFHQVFQFKAITFVSFLYPNMQNIPNGFQFMHDESHSQRAALHSKRNQRTEHPRGGAFGDSDGETGAGNRRGQLQGDADQYQNLRPEQLPLSQHNVILNFLHKKKLLINQQIGFFQEVQNAWECRPSVHRTGRRLRDLWESTCGTHSGKWTFHSQYQ